ncbi:hypothetical protein K3495_g2200 [Podosphaera aphanis]|nr:hypothetical protein K3495_g2200 [Podosphaera aphanis]
MSNRNLGGGRIIGSGKPLAPIAPVAPQLTSDPNSITENIASSSSASKRLYLLEGDQDLFSAVCRQNGDLQSADSSTTSLSNLPLHCPICNEEMMTLLQLNRHLDDNHQELPEVQNDEVKTWLDKQVVKAKKFQPLVVINQKLKGLDVFESNGSPLAINLTSTEIVPGNRISFPEARPDSDNVVTRAHWQKLGYNDQCMQLLCGKRLGPVNGSVNCRKCGKLFCEEHTMYQMKLSRSAQHEPVRGFWCRVCETCYKSRDGYNDHHGLERDHTQIFTAARKKTVDKAYLEISRLEKRLTKLTQLLTDYTDSLSKNGGVIMSLAGQSNQRKKLEQLVVTWEDDMMVAKCPICCQDFGAWLHRRHHCRLCGRVVCAELEMGCSSEISLNVTAKTGHLTLDIRMCRNCQSTVFSKKDFDAEVLHKPPDQRAYENLMQFEQGIQLLFPNFRRLLIVLQDPDTPPSRAQITEAAKVRKRLIDSFSKYDIAAKRLRDLPSQSLIQQRLQNAIYQRSSNFLSIHMLPLKSLPKILKHASPHGHSVSHSSITLASIKQSSSETPSLVSSSSAVSAMEAEEKELSMQIMVIEEQRFLLNEMISAARKARRFDELVLLGENAAELDRECDRLRGLLGQLDFKNAYVT